MRIVGHGIDLIDTDRVARMLETHGDRFLLRCFTEHERDYVAAHPRRRAEHLAGRFAAKEAALKALGTGWARGIAWTDVEVMRADAGPPTLQLHGQARAIAKQCAITQWWLSLSHIHSHAIASAIAVADD